jgi:hypothetical protein
MENELPIVNENEVISESITEVENILQSIPSSSEITATIKAANAPYSSLVLNNPSNAENYNSNYRKAINLGVYGTDLGYIGVYSKSDVMIEHLKVINQLASEIDLAHLMRNQKVRELNDRGHLIDSIFHISTEIFEDICKYLNSNERQEISVLILLGGWLEALHIASTVSYNAKFENPNLYDKIAQQKEVLDKFIKVVSQFSKDPFFNKLLVGLNGIKTTFNDVSYTPQQVNQDTSVIRVPSLNAQLSQVQLAQITIKVNDLRKEIVNP